MLDRFASSSPSGTAAVGAASVPRRARFTSPLAVRVGASPPACATGAGGTAGCCGWGPVV